MQVRLNGKSDPVVLAFSQSLLNWLQRDVDCPFYSVFYLSALPNEYLNVDYFSVLFDTYSR